MLTLFNPLSLYKQWEMGFFLSQPKNKKKKKERKIDNPENIVVICVTALLLQHVHNMVCAVSERAGVLFLAQSLNWKPYKSDI